ncbi:MAG: DNA recombination protein RmuC [Lysobacterales bacterium]
MQIPFPTTLAILAALAGLFAGLLLLYLVSRRWIAAAHAAGRASRDAEAATLTEQRDGATQRAGEFAARVERYERDWIQAEQSLRQLSAHAAAQQTQAEQLGHELADVRRSRDDAQARLVDLTGRHAALEAGAHAQAQAATEKLQLLEQAEQRLRESFQNLANGILEDKAERFREQSVQQVGGLLDPLKLQIKEFRDRIDVVHSGDQRERGVLANEIQTLKQLNQRISEDATNLTKALKGDTRSQGAWGELVLERLLEASGLVKGREYEIQLNLRDEDGGRWRPDVIVHLPDKRDIVIDAKMSLTAYERYCTATEPAERANHLRQHLDSVRMKVKELADRGYADLPGIETLDFVLMFVPVEAAYIEAVRADDGLHAFALGRRVIIVTTSTLLATLRTVTNLWRFEDRNRNAIEIADRAGKLYDKFVGFVNDLEKTRLSLTGAQRMLDDALGKLSTAPGNLVGQVEKLRVLGARATKSLDSKRIEEAESMELDLPAPDGIE